MDKSNKAIIGKDVIESLTLGMYEDARIIYREYIQNSADQIDKAVQQGILTSTIEGNIWIDIDINMKQIVIEDNATGISSKEAVSILKNIAQSTKQRGVDKGFRGIGRLGGLAYCDRLTFETSYKGEDCKTVIEWDAKKLKHIINNRHTKETASDVIDEITHTSEIKEKIETHYFKVILNNVANWLLLDVDGIRGYLAMVAPANFHPRFTFLPKIKEYIKNNNILIDEYSIFVNQEELYKAYTTKLYEFVDNNTKKTLDEIKDIVFFDKGSEDGSLLYWGWYGVWSFSKQIPDKVNPARGFRLRKNNIQIGDETRLVKLHKEPRGNFYYFGEVYAVHSELIPNARRDYFLQNSALDELEKYLKEYFKELYDLYHLSSKVRSALREISKFDDINNQIISKKNIYSSNHERDELIRKQQEQKEKKEKARNDLLKIIDSSNNIDANKRILKELIKDPTILDEASKQPIFIQQESEELDKPIILFIDDNTLPRQSREERKLIKKVYDIVSNCLPDKDIVENIRLKIIEEFNRNKQDNG